ARPGAIAARYRASARGDAGAEITGSRACARLDAGAQSGGDAAGSPGTAKEVPRKQAKREPAETAPVPTAPPAAVAPAHRPAAPAPGRVSRPSPIAIASWQRLLVAQLERNKRYPEAAGGVQGVT